MEPHPVPQDIINAEFKLFGSFTLKQFLMIVGGCLMGLFIFLLSIPILIKVPLIAAVILTGVGLAIIPNFNTWMSGYLKALFISPRYVWVKEPQTPDLLKTKMQQASDESTKITTGARNSSKIDLSEISLEKLLATRDNPMKSTMPDSTDVFDNSPRDQNLNRVFKEIYKDEPAKVSPQMNPILAQDTRPPKTGRTKQDYVNEINFLKQQMGTLVKDQHYKEKEAEILHRLNDLYQDLKMMDMEDMMPRNAVKQGIVTDFKGSRQVSGQTVTGVVVDKADAPIGGAKIVFKNIAEPEYTFKVNVTASGKFMSKDKMPDGDYDVEITHPNHRFHNYKIKVGTQKLPAYKLRAK